MKRILFALASLVMTLTVTAQSGHVMNGVGPVDQGMAGAGMAAPRDALTALHWNPAAVFALPGRSLDIGLQMMMPTGTIGSNVEAGAFGEIPNFLDPSGPPSVPYPWAAVGGTSDSDAGPFPIPAVGFLNVREDRPIAFGVSAFGVGGFGVDYTLSPMPLGSLPDNPILSPQQGELGMGFGALSSEFALLQVAPTVAYRVSDRLWIGVAPTVSFASLELSVFPATAPTPVETPLGFLPMYPDAPQDWAMGFGFQAGVHAQAESGISVGLSYKSRQVFEEFEFSPEMSGAGDYTFRLDYPQILSAGVAYTVSDRFTVVGDVRYIDYANTPGFDETGFDETGAVRGFGWKSVGVYAVAAEYRFMDTIPVRVGYSYNDSPIESDQTFFNSPAPAIVQHHLATGFSLEFGGGITASLAAQLGLTESVSGNWKTIDPTTGQTVSIPGTAVQSELSTLTLIGGVHVRL